MQTLTLDVGGTNGLFELRHEGHTEQYKFPTGDGFSIRDLNEQIQAFEQDFALEHYRLAIAVPGLVRDNRLVTCKSLPGLTGLHPAQIQCSGELAFIVNDMDAGIQAIAEPRHDCEVLVMCGAGLGMAIAMNGQVFSGASGFAGELGHCRIMTEGGEFSLEQLASAEALRGRKQVMGDDLVQAGRHLGMGLAWVVNLFNPNRIYLAGSMMHSADFYKGCIGALKDMALGAPMANCQVHRVDDMETLVCRGLATMLEKQQHAGE
ncbi:ROK family protein [Shewanella sp. FJAT-52076]|uniref:ROK family protein n=1 Tax=Shewanella sp. FJAT-52076 TaxID=2864202 RepID=UPI001C654D2C|nr:ROK family protein [Shewanella sp. FJAT-52076]QYJ76056.1 ROK family protein [Shewanella sp. FJAT-52076]